MVYYKQWECFKKLSAAPDGRHRSWLVLVSIEAVGLGTETYFTKNENYTKQLWGKMRPSECLKYIVCPISNKTMLLKFLTLLETYQSNIFQTNDCYPAENFRIIFSQKPESLRDIFIHALLCNFRWTAGPSEEQLLEGGWCNRSLFTVTSSETIQTWFQLFLQT